MARPVAGHALRQSKLLRQVAKEDLFEDGPHWDVPDEECGQVVRPAGTTGTTATAMATLQVAASTRRASTASTEAAANSIPTLDGEAAKA